MKLYIKSNSSDSVDNSIQLLQYLEAIKSKLNLNIVNIDTENISNWYSYITIILDNDISLRLVFDKNGEQIKYNFNDYNHTLSINVPYNKVTPDDLVDWAINKFYYLTRIDLYSYLVSNRWEVDDSTSSISGRTPVSFWAEKAIPGDKACGLVFFKISQDVSNCVITESDELSAHFEVCAYGLSSDDINTISGQVSVIEANFSKYETDWPKSSVWRNVEDDFDDLWSKYLQNPETEVNIELKIYPEPSIQGGEGAMYIYDESTENRFNAISIDFNKWTSKELSMARSSKSVAEYKNKYKMFVKKLCGI